MKLKSLAQKRDLMKASFVKDNYLISKGILLVSRPNFNPIVKEKSRRERRYQSLMWREAENKVVSVSFGISYLKGKS